MILVMVHQEISALEIMPQNIILSHPKYPLNKVSQILLLEMCSFDPHHKHESKTNHGHFQNRVLLFTFFKLSSLNEYYLDYEWNLEEKHFFVIFYWFFGSHAILFHTPITNFTHPKLKFDRNMVAPLENLKEWSILLADSITLWFSSTHKKILSFTQHWKIYHLKPRTLILLSIYSHPTIQLNSHKDMLFSIIFEFVLSHQNM